MDNNSILMGFRWKNSDQPTSDTYRWLQDPALPLSYEIAAGRAAVGEKERNALYKQYERAVQITSTCLRDRTLPLFYQWAFEMYLCMLAFHLPGC